MKQLIYDYVHCTQMEFLLKHPIAILVMFVSIFAIGSIVFYVQDKIRNRGKKNER